MRKAVNSNARAGDGEDETDRVEQRLFTKWAVVLIAGLFSVIAWFASDTYKHVTDPSLARELSQRLQEQQSVINNNVTKIAVLEEKVGNIERVTARTEDTTSEILKLMRRRDRDR